MIQWKRAAGLGLLSWVIPSEIGLSYLTFPAFAFGAARLARS
jgi:hypothetical protein